jgi:ABC-type multidrug transport system ATPase subunit
VIAAVDNLSIHYGKRAAVDGLSFELYAGEIALMLGPNGAGKSTTLAAMAGAVLPSAGTIAVSGEDLASAPRSARKKVGFADQPPALYEFFTVAEHVGFVAQARGALDAARPRGQRRGDPDVDALARRRRADVRSHPAHGQGQARRRQAR